MTLPLDGVEGLKSDTTLHSVTVIVVTFQNRGTIDALLDSIPAAAPETDWSVVVVDNGSTDGTLDHIRGRESIEIVESGGNYGYAAGINLGLKRARPGSAIAIINPDVRLRPGSLTTLLNALNKPDVGVVVPQICDEHERRFPSLRREPTVLSAFGDALFGSRWQARPKALSDILWRDEDYEYAHNVDWASGAAWILSAECNAATGRWDERFFLYSEETDYARRVRSTGLHIRYVPEAQVSHIGGASGRSMRLDALMELNRFFDFQQGHGRVTSLTFFFAVLLKHVVRSKDGAHRAILRALLSHGRQRPTAPELRKWCAT